MKWSSVVIILLAAAAHVAAQPVVPPDREALLGGTLTDQSGIADNGGYPTIERLAVMKEALGLTRDQQKKIDALRKDLPIALKVKGEEIVEAEEDLLRSLRSGAASEKQIRVKVETIGKLRGELRFAQIQPSLKLKQILSQNQLERYKELVATPAH